MVELFTNNAHGLLSAGIGPGDLSLALEAGDGALFPNPTAPDFFRATLVRSDASASEIIFCTARAADTLTIVRGQEGTTPVSFSVGDRLRLMPTAGMFEALAAVIEADNRAFLHGWAGNGSSFATQFGISFTSTGGTRTYNPLSAASQRATIPGVIHTATGPTQILGYGIGINSGRVCRGNALNRGGFDQTWIFSVASDLTGMYAFWGLDDSNSATYSGGTPEGRTAVEQIGIGWASSSSAGGNFFLYHNDGAAPMGIIDTGMARDTTSIFRLRISALPNDSVISVVFENLTTGEVFAQDLSADIPASTSFLVGRHVASGVTGGAICLHGFWRFNVNQSEPVVV